MAIHTSAIFYRRGVPNSYKNFGFVSQTNNTIISPMSIYLRNFQFYNRNITNSMNGYKTLPWRI
jgi:hypothetical protein